MPGRAHTRTLYTHERTAIRTNERARAHTQRHTQQHTQRHTQRHACTHRDTRAHTQDQRCIPQLQQPAHAPNTQIVCATDHGCWELEFVRIDLDVVRDVKQLACWHTHGHTKAHTQAHTGTHRHTLLNAHRRVFCMKPLTRNILPNGGGTSADHSRRFRQRTTPPLCPLARHTCLPTMGTPTGTRHGVSTYGGPVWSGR